MAIINSYPNITPKAEDLLLISDTSVDGNPTKTATINNVLALLPSSGGGGGISSITSNNTNFLSVTNPTGPLVTLNIQTGFVASGGNTLATTGDIYTFTNTSITNAINNLGALTSFACDISNIPAFISNVTTSAAGATVLTISRTGGSTNQFLDYTGNWSTPSVQGMTFWELTADTGGSDKIEQGDALDIEGDGVKISTQFTNPSQGQYFITVSHNAQSQSDTIITKTLTNGESFFALSGKVGVDPTGHVTGQQVTEYTLPSNAINSIGVNAPVQNTGTPSDPIIAMLAADGATDGYLSSTKFAEFDAKQTEISLSVSGTSGAATFNAATGALNIPIYSGGGGGGVSGVGLSASAFNAFSVTTLGGGPNPITGSDTFVLGINGTTSSSEYLDGSGNWSTPAGTGTDLSNVINTNNVQIINSSGTNTDVPAATTTTAGAMTAADKLRLNQLIITTSSETALGPSTPNTSSNTLTLPWNGSSSQVVLGDGSLTTLPTQFNWTLDGDTGSNPVSDGATIQIIGGTGISTAVSGNTLTVTNTSSGTVQSIGAANSTFINGAASTSPNPITTTGTLSYDLNAVGPTNNTVADPNESCFLRGDNKWAKFAMGPGIFINSNTSAPFQTSIKVNYNGAQNVIKSANSVPAAGVDLSDTIIMNDATNSLVYETTLQSIQNAMGISKSPTYFSVDSSGNFQNSGNMSDDTQGFGTITPTLESSGNGFVISFSKTQSDNRYMINFTVEAPLVFGSADYAISAWVPSSLKTTSGFTILYDKGGSGTGLGAPELTNFQLYK